MSYQVSIFLENKLGHLERVTAVLSAACINIRSIHINHTANGWGILNLVVSEPERAQKLLDAAGMTAALREIGAVKTVFELMELEGLSVKEVAEATGASANTVLSRKHYAVKHLRKRLEGLYNDILTY